MIYLISETYLKENSVINENVDMKLLTPVIIMCQDMYIHPLLGSDLYKLILAQVEVGTIAGDNKTLLDDYIRPALRWYVLAESPVTLNYKLTNKSVAKKNSDNSQPADLNETLALVERFRNTAEWYAERVTRFITANPTLYPAYYTRDNLDDIPPNKTNYTTGWNLDIEYRPKTFAEKYDGKYGIC